MKEQPQPKPEIEPGRTPAPAPAPPRPPEVPPPIKEPKQPIPADPKAALLLVLIALACNKAPETETLIQFDTGAVAIQTPTDTVQLRVEVADSRTERSYGLMDRPSLDPESGMLFVYDAVQDSASGFWMYRTKIPLDIAFIDSAGRIANIIAMDACTSPEPRWCKPYMAAVRYQSALEVNRSFFQNHGIAVGAKVVRLKP